MHIFARITKVDESTGKVYGRAVQEVPDRSGEIFDYATSKPNFEKWSESMAKATDGKSVGNVRAMHGNVAAGKLTEITFEDAAKAIDVCAEIVDPVERAKCVKGVYSGFSIGGRYAKKWTDGENANLTRYTAEPVEISLVDMPCVPTAQFTVVKADGSQELRKFETSTDDTEAVVKWADTLPVAIHNALLAKIAERQDVSPEEGEHKYGDVEFADAKNKKYPIDTAEHIRAAWNYINKGSDADKYSGGDVAAIKAKIIAAWKDKIDPKGPPSAEKTVENEMDNAAQGGEVQKTVGESSASELHDFIDSLADETEPDNDDALDALDDAHDAIGGDDEMAKGDFPGHPFRDNQYVVGGGSSAHHRASFRAHNATKATQGKGSSKASHMEAAAKHDRAARSAKRAGADHTAEYHQSMARYHTARANRFKKSGDVDLTKVADELTMVTAERDELVKGMEAIKEELERIKAQPAPTKGVVRVVEKSLDGEEPASVDDRPVLKHDGSVDAVATAEKLAKLAYSNPRKFQ